jgi:hypothetical protein
MNFNTPKFDAAVTSFKALCPGHPQLFQYGQFYVTRRTIDDLFGTITVELQNNLRLSINPPELNGAINFFKTKLSGRVMNIPLASINTMLDVMDPVYGGMAPIRALFVAGKNDRANAQSDFDAVWSTPDIPAAPALSGSAPTLAKAQAAYQLERDKCFYVLRAFAKKLLKKRGVGPLPQAAIISDMLVGGAFLKDAAPARGTETGRQEIGYGAPNLLAAATARMRAAINADGYIHCGVLSGAMHENSKFPQPEHHVMVFAHDTVGGRDAFLFWDPDAAHSEIASTNWGQGFGVLFSRAGRLTTAVDDADFAAVDRHSAADTFGDHTNDPLRHCYQVYTLQTLPMRAALKLHVKVLQPPARASVDDMLFNAVAVYASRDIEILEASREIIDTAGTELEKFQTLYVGDDPAGAPTAEVTELHSMLRADGGESGVEPVANEIVVAFVRTLVPAGFASASHPPEQPGAVLSASLAGEWALAHEIGHLAGLEHSADANDLMFKSTAGIVEASPALRDDEVATVLASPLAQV